MLASRRRIIRFDYDPRFTRRCRNVICDRGPLGMGTRPIPVPMERNDRMAILTAVTIQPRSAEVWDDLQKLLKRLTEMVEKKGAENVTVLATLVGGEATNQLVVLASSENWSKYGQVQEAFYGDPKAQALLLEVGKLATWQTYAAQTLEL